MNKPANIVGTWSVEYIGGEAPIEDSHPTVQFDATGRLLATAGLNRIMGSYDVADGHLTTTPLASTRMAGSEALMEQERRLIAALQAGGPIRADADTAEIGDGDEALVLAKSRPDGSPVTVGGSVWFRERMLLPAEAVIAVRLSDVSRADAPATVLAEKIMSDVGTPPFRFELQVADAASIDPRARLAVSCRIELNGHLMFVSDTHIPVDLQTPRDDIDVLVVRVPFEAAPPSTAADPPAQPETE